ncbi:MAG: RluA family pseudouridine synthase [Verrucomicrobia bacterium]|nr:RluA family pseudouridine synthase [Verrucomicrobiota bacterium]MBU6446760.1 RluA family pseudouridine synthase [Verrucomicrobiota bacterium]MDE3047486.1 RluA family pseudouridine synthase [Verrucomicrobiota bacterium]
MEYIVPKEMSLIEALRQIFPDSSRRTLQNWLKNGRFRLDGKKVEREDIPLQAGQTLAVKDTFQAPKVPGLNILYEDRFFIVIDKPVGLLSVPLDESQNKKHALGLLREHLGTDQIYAVHRIDRETSGILLFARGKDSEEKFDKLFEQHDIVREYYAIVEGRVKEEKGVWQSKLLELPSLHVVVSDMGKDAITHYAVIRRSAKYTYLKLRLETGRKHQIRVHCQMAGHPVVGDVRYGSVQSPLKRLCLHACTLGFEHPFTHKPVEFISPLPESFKVLGGGGSKRDFF